MHVADMLNTTTMQIRMRAWWHHHTSVLTHGVCCVLQVLTELAGTIGYIAPEVLARCYTEQADVWSTGVMLYEMVCGQLPYRLGNTCEEVSRRLHLCASSARLQATCVHRHFVAQWAHSILPILHTAASILSKGLTPLQTSSSSPDYPIYSSTLKCLLFVCDSVLRFHYPSTVPGSH